MMERMLKQHVGLAREDVHWTNAVACDVDEQDLSAARKCCAPRLRYELENIREVDAPVVAVGGHALHTAIGTGRKPSILNYRGAVIERGDPVRGTASVERMILPTVHPAFVMRSPLWMPIFQADMQRVGRILRDGYTRPEDQPGRGIVVVQTVEQLKDELAKLDEYVAVDTETTGLDIHTVRMTCLVISDTATAVVIPWSKTQSGEGCFFNGRQPEALAVINEALANRVSITHNGYVYDHTVLKRHGIQLGRCEDTLIAYHVLTSFLPKNLSHVSRCFLDVPPWKEWDHGESLETLWEYCGRDGLYTALDWPAITSQFDENDWRVYESDKQSATLCREMSRNGFAFDEDQAYTMAISLLNREHALLREAAELLGVKEINLLSPIQLRAAFFDQLGAPVLAVSEETKQPSLNVDTMRAYAASANETLARFAEIVLEYRRLRKCRTTYIEGVHVYPDGRVRATWLTYGTVSGRFSAKQPNLANLPRLSNDPSAHEECKKAPKPCGACGIRSLYIAPKGRKLVAFDVSQMEFRVAAYLTNDPNMIQACNELDIHSANAALLFGDHFRRLEKGSAQHTRFRTLAKSATFAVCYLAEPPTVHARLVADGIQITLREVEAMITQLKKAFRQYYFWQAENLDLTIRRGYVESPILKRKRWLGHAPEPPANANFPIQSGAADVFNLKSAEILRRLKGLDAFPVAAVYDALYIDCVESEVDEVTRIIKEVWDEPVRLGEHDVTFKIDLHVGDRWSQL